jgi:hypothetical protein
MLLTPTRESNVVRSQNKDFEVHQPSKSFFVKAMDALEYYDWGCFNQQCFLESAMCIEIVGWDFSILVVEQSLEAVISFVQVKGLGVIEVVV